LLGGSALAVTKQTYWMLFVSQETFSLFNAVAFPFINSTTEVIEAALYFWLWSSAASPAGEAVTGPIAFGAVLLVAGVSTEWFSEYQRKRFKNNPRNKGKVFQGGLFGLARHINFAGFATWKAGQAYMSTGWAVGTAIAAVFLRFFDGQAIPPLDEYCQERYGAQWSRYKKEVPSKLIPGLW
jgi:steroid 5-alpha reductase family enzyme